MEVKIILLIMWIFIGITNIIYSIVCDGKKVSLWSYSLTWVLLITCLLERIIVK